MKTEQQIRAEISDCGFRIAALKNERGWWVNDDRFKLLNRIAALEWLVGKPKPKPTPPADESDRDRV